MRLSALHKTLFAWLVAFLPLVVAAAPAPEVVRWSDIRLVDGSVMKARDLAGKTVVVEFWARCWRLPPPRACRSRRATRWPPRPRPRRCTSCRASATCSFLHFTDCHAQLLPIYFREPSVNLGIGDSMGQPPHLVGEHLLKRFGIAAGTPEAHAFTYLDFVAGRQDLRQGRRLRAPVHAGQAHEGLAPRARCCSTAATPGRARHRAVDQRAQDMVDACKLLGVDVMTPHWEFTYGQKRVQEIVEKDFKGKIDFVAQNVKTTDFGDPVFAPYTMREMNGVQGRRHRPGVPVHADRQPALHGARLDLRHPGRQHAEGGRRGARQGRAGRGGAVAQRHGRRPEDGLARARHRRDPGRPHARRRAGAEPGEERRRHHAGDQRRQQRQVPRRARLRREGGKVSDFRYKLLPVFSNLLPADKEMEAFIDKVRAPYEGKLDEKLAVTEGLLYRRGNFNGTFDQVILRRADGGQGRRHRVLAGLPLGHVAAARPGDHLWST
jgi:S-sulfosulfanyl-L-cysteine sulfohydrolase